MALALFRPGRVPGTPGTVSFQVDLGTNRYYQYAIGDDTVDRDRGFPVLGAPSFTSPLAGPLPDQALGRAVLEVPVSRFDREHRSIQLTSFRNPARHGAAVSDIQRVGVLPRVREDLPPIAFSMRPEMDTYTVESHRAAPWRYAEPMSYREVRPMSGAMFLDRIIPALKAIVSKVAPVVGSVLAKVPAPGAPVGAGGESPLAAIGALLGSKGGAALADAVQSTLKPETVAKLMEFLQQLKQPTAEPAKASSLAVAQKYAVATEYSHASVAPALLAALPALMPLLEKVLTPETIKGLLDAANPTKIIGAVTDSVKEIGKLGLDFDKQSNEHLRALNPMGVHAPVDDLLKGMGFASAMAHGVAKYRGEPAYRRVESVEISFAGASPVMIHGRSRVCYRTGEAIAFALEVKTPRPIPEATIAVLVKHPETRAILARQTVGVSQVTTGKLPKRVALSGKELDALHTGEEYLVCVYLTWKNGKGKVIGTSRTQMITLIGEYVFDRVEDGVVVPLNDVAKYRPFWHRAWQGSFSKELYKVDFEGKYYYILEPDRPANAPVETAVSLERGDAHVKKGRLKSGLTISLGALNALIPLISNGAPLGAPQLSALHSSDFVSRFNTAARFSAALSGKPGVSAALWIYPEVKLHEVVLFKAASTDADSHVRELVEERVRFPIPVSIHVIGARSTR
ncbi:MAG: hypothetical protein ACT4P7_13390 [Gemmatimonadaceae bacterium]